MESVHKGVLIGFVAFIIGSVIFGLGMYWISCHRQVEMAKAGFEQVQTIGRGDYVWQKVTPEHKPESSQFHFNFDK